VVPYSWRRGGPLVVAGDIKNYVSNLLVKLGMSRRTEAAVFVTRADLHKRRSFSGPE